MPDRIFIGVAWPYANGPLHLGHLAGAYLPADIFARFHRMRGNEVLMVSGSDSHGAPITLRAESEGVTPREIVEKYHASFLSSFAQLGISFDLFTTTMTENHRQTAHELFTRLHNDGYIVPGSMKVAYSPDFNRYLPDRYVRGTCPSCANEDARGDQCDNCGSILDPIDLKDPTYVREDGRYPIEIRDTEHLFLRLGKFEDRLLPWVRKQDHWRPNVRNFSRGFLEEGLRDRAITRNLDWGLDVPISGYEDNRLYVWFEAVIGYLSASREWASQRGQPDAWKPFWEDDNTRSYYFIGKDNIPFHTIIWPAILMGDARYLLPFDVPANEFLTLESRQLSTSRNWAVWVPDYLERFEPDPLRYHLSANMPETGDSDFSWSEYVRRNNDELVATFGNLVHRTLTQIYRNFDGAIPAPGSLSDEDHELMEVADQALQNVASSIGSVRLREALGHAMGLARAANRYLDSKAPWAQIKENREAAATTLHTVLYAIGGLKIAFYPFLPFSAQKLHTLLGLSGSVENDHWTIAEPKPGTALPEPKPLFIKLDADVAEEMIAHLGNDK